MGVSVGAAFEWTIPSTGTWATRIWPPQAPNPPGPESALGAATPPPSRNDPPPMLPPRTPPLRPSPAARSTRPTLPLTDRSPLHYHPSGDDNRREIHSLQGRPSGEGRRESRQSEALTEGHSKPKFKRPEFMRPKLAGPAVNGPASVDTARHSLHARMLNAEESGQDRVKTDTIPGSATLEPGQLAELGTNLREVSERTPKSLRSGSHRQRPRPARPPPSSRHGASELTCTQMAVADDEGISTHARGGANVTLMSRWQGSFDESMEEEDGEDQEGAAGHVIPSSPWAV